MPAERSIFQMSSTAVTSTKPGTRNSTAETKPTWLPGVATPRASRPTTTVRYARDATVAAMIVVPKTLNDLWCIARRVA